MFRLKDIKKTYRSKRSSDTLALDGVTLEFPSKGLIFIVGESGSGKSTLLNVLGGLDSIDSGNIIFNGKDIALFNEKEMDSYRNTSVGFIFQDYNLLETYNVYDNIELALNLQMGKDQDQRIDKLLEDIGLKGLKNRKINELSGGQKQRVAIARALIKDPAVILADEPTGNLDTKASNQIFKLLKEISASRLVIVVSHNTEAAKTYGDRIIKLVDGAVASDNYKAEKLVDEDIVYRSFKLLNKDAFRLCLANIAKKKARFFLTIILSMFAILFMIFSFNVYIFDSNAHKFKTLLNNEEYYINLNKSICASESGYLNCRRTEMSDEEIHTIAQNISLSKGIIYYLNNSGVGLNFTFGPIEEDYRTFYNNRADTHIVEIIDDEILGNLIGRAPKNPDEVVISEVIADRILYSGIEDHKGNMFKPSSFEELLEHDTYYNLGDYPVKIVGISLINNDDFLSEYKKHNLDLDNELSNVVDDVYATDYIYVKGLVDKLNLTYDEDIILENFYIYTPYYRVLKKEYLTDEITYYNYDGEQVTSELAYNEIIVSIEHIVQEEEYLNSFNNFLKEHPEYNYTEGKKAYIKDFVVGNEHFKDAKTYFETSFAFKEGDKINNFKIVGVTDADTTYFSPHLKEHLEDPTKETIGLRLYTEDEEELKNMIETYPGFFDLETVGTHYNIEYRFMADLHFVKQFYKAIHNYLAFITIIFIIFMVLLLYNFIVATVAASKKEIGILRALGASNKDVTKIFGFESLILGITSLILGIILFIIAVIPLNNSEPFSSLQGIEVILIDIRSIIFSILFTLIICLLLSILSINRVSKIKPIDAILDK